MAIETRDVGIGLGETYDARIAEKKRCPGLNNCGHLALPSTKVRGFSATKPCTIFSIFYERGQAACIPLRGFRWQFL